MALCHRCWTDRLIEVPREFNSPSCSLEDSLVEWANEDCGKVHPCNKPDIKQVHSKFTVTTLAKGAKPVWAARCTPISDIPAASPWMWEYPEPPIEVLKRRSETAFEMLKQYLFVFDNITALRQRGDLHLVDHIVANELANFTRYLDDIRTEKEKQKQRHDSEKFFEEYKPGSVATRQAFRHSLKEYLFYQAGTRMTITFEVLLTLIEKDDVLFSREEKGQLRNDLRRTKFNYAWETAIMSPRNELFPELEDEMHDYYISILQQSTIGLQPKELDFFGDSDSTEKLIHLYETVLEEGRWTNHGILTSLSVFGLWLLSTVLILAIATSCVLTRNRKKQPEGEDKEESDVEKQFSSSERCSLLGSTWTVETWFFK
uniref:Anoctamin n=1 Tax=Steinernema glaseri TaxID=37863 RepID=A0A1I7Y3P6_9BILA